MRYYHSGYFLYSLTFSDGKRYIGVTANPLSRATTLRHRFKREFIMSVICIGSRDYILDLEAKAIIAFRTNDPEIGYNELIGRNLPLITRWKIGEARMGQVPWNKGIKRTAKERRAIKIALAESEIFDPNRIAGWNKGVPHSKKHKAKISAAMKGRIFSAEHRKNISLAKRGKPIHHAK